MNEVLLAVIPLLGIYLEKTNSKRLKHQMFTAALSTTARTWKQCPKCPSTEERIKKMWYIHRVEYYSATNKECNNAICSSMDVTVKSSQREKEKHLVSLTRGI